MGCTENLLLLHLLNIKFDQGVQTLTHKNKLALTQNMPLNFESSLFCPSLGFQKH